MHLLVHGVRDDGRTLKLDCDYARHGIRELSQELLERELGLRLEREVLLARGRTVEREPWTEIDRALDRRAASDRLVTYADFEPYGEGARVRKEQEIERLSFLEKLRLARQVSDRSWGVSPEHEPAAQAVAASAGHPQEPRARVAEGTRLEGSA